MKRIDRLIQFCSKAEAELSDLQNLSIFDQSFGTEDEGTFGIFCRTLPQCPNLRTLNVASNNLIAFDTKRFKTLGRALSQCQNLQSIDLGENDFDQLTSENFKAFYDELSKSNTLIQIEGIEEFNEKQHKALSGILERNKRYIQNVQKTTPNALPSEPFMTGDLHSPLMQNTSSGSPPPNQADFNQDEMFSNISSAPNIFRVFPIENTSQAPLKQDNKEIKQRAGFLTRHPEKVTQKLDEGKFLLGKELRKELAEKIKNNPSGWTTLKDNVTKEIHEVYINRDKQAFVYRKDLWLGEGSFGRVYITQNALTGKWHCMKIYKGALAETEIDLLQKEGMFVSSESTVAGDLFISELIHGKTLDTVLQQEKLSFEQALALNISLVEAYESLHRKGYVHRDIKPDNIIIDFDQHKCIAIDFGLAQEQEAQHHQKGASAYAPLEAFHRAPPRIQDDIYSMGIVAGQILSSRMDAKNFKALLTLGELSPRRAKYVDKIMALQKKPETFQKICDDLFPIVLGAKYKAFQKNLSPQEIALCTLIFDMTDDPEGRPTNTSSILKSMRNIRETHIESRMKAFSLDNEYGKALNALFAKRPLFIDFPRALDNLDTLLLRAVDAVKENRPDASELRDYREKFENLLTQKTMLEPEIQEYIAQKESNKPITFHYTAQNLDAIGQPKEKRPDATQNPKNASKPST